MKKAFAGLAIKDEDKDDVIGNYFTIKFPLIVHVHAHNR